MTPSCFPCLSNNHAHVNGYVHAHMHAYPHITPPLSRVPILLTPSDFPNTDRHATLPSSVDAQSQIVWCPTKHPEAHEWIIFFSVNKSWWLQTQYRCNITYESLWEGKNKTEQKINTLSYFLKIANILNPYKDTKIFFFSLTYWLGCIQKTHSATKKIAIIKMKHKRRKK